MDCLACHSENLDGARFCLKCGAPLPVPRGADADPLIGVTVGGRYRVTGVLGEGGMGRVYLGEQQMGTTIRKVAIKTLHAQLAKDPQVVARFMREVATISELEHPNTIKVYDYGKLEASGELYIAMEVLTGMALDDALASGPMHPERVDRIIGQVCGSLLEAHEKGIVHRDLKPANIYLTVRAGESDIVKVLDFGIAKRGASSGTEQKLTQQGTILGTPPYMSPEQFTGRDLDARSDIYSLGVVAYEMLTGRLPYEADTPWQWMTQHMNAQPFPFDTTPAGLAVPPKMKAAVMRALAKDPAQRPQTTRELYEELTLGTMRMSAIGLGSGGVGAIPSIPSGGAYSGGYGASPAGYSSRPPFAEERSFPNSPSYSPPAGNLGPMTSPLPRPQTMAGDPAAAYSSDGGYGQYPQATAPGYDPYAQRSSQPYMTSSGQAFPAPPPKPARAGAGLLVGAALGLAALGGAGTFIYWKTTQTPTDETAEETVSVPTPAATQPPTAETTVAQADPAPTHKKPATKVRPTATALPGHTPTPTLEEWATAKDATVTNAAKLGCEAKAIREWVRVLCKGKNDSGGAPLSVKIDKGGDKGDVLSFVQEGTTSLVYPFEDGTDLEATFTWTDKSSTFKAAWPKFTPKPATVGAFVIAPTVVANNGLHFPKAPVPETPVYVPPPTTMPDLPRRPDRTSPDRTRPDRGDRRPTRDPVDRGNRRPTRRGR